MHGSYRYRGTFGHARTGDGTFNSYAEFSDALERVKNVLGTKGLQTLHFHISGIDYGPKGEKAHVPLNEADLKYRELLQAFVDYGVKGTAAIEAPLPFHVADALTFQATYRRLLDLKYGAGKAGGADVGE